MGVGEVDVDVERREAREFDAERTDAGAGVENQPSAASRHFEAGCVAAVAHVFGTGAGNRTANAPKTDFQTISQNEFPKNSAQSPQPAPRVNRRQSNPGWPRSCVEQSVRLDAAYLQYGGQFVPLSRVAWNPIRSNTF